MCNLSNRFSQLMCKLYFLMIFMYKQTFKYMIHTAFMNKQSQHERFCCVFISGKAAHFLLLMNPASVHASCAWWHHLTSVGPASPHVTFSFLRLFRQRSVDAELHLNRRKKTKSKKNRKKTNTKMATRVSLFEANIWTLIQVHDDRETLSTNPTVYLKG